MNNELNRHSMAAKGLPVTLVGGVDGRTPLLEIDIRDADGSVHRTAYEPPPEPFTDSTFSPKTAALHDPLKRTFIERDPAADLAVNVFTALALAERAKVAAATNAHLTTTGKRDAVAAATVPALVEIASHNQELARLASGLEAERAALYAPPAPTAIDAPQDAELRGELRRMTPNERLTLLGNLGKPELAGLLLALKRSVLPWPENEAALIETAWQGHVAATKPEAVRKLQSQRANAQWAVGIVGFMARKALEHSGMERFPAYKALAPTGYAALFGFDSMESAAFDHRLARETAAAKARESRNARTAA